ncbi:DUF2191 domain-containing protein [Halomonas heilongjiangensis]|uniref:DUF2191 domain-containing protein n=1 Tax=Halomonas heilongjiangensis TaxID=1387883 RepID=A0A2N7TU75_9GAMM|nr:DUF2191 domain-containing protein [Halomonas heilongjiangensis]PXX89986.1 DUF2191 domain-containing protein [Halomonas heilongjiangensis]
MEITASIDDELYRQALEMSESGLDNASDLFHEVLKTYVRIQVGRRRGASGGDAPDMQDIPREG